MKMNEMAQVEFEPIYYGFAVQYFNQYATVSSFLFLHPSFFSFSHLR